MGEEGVSLPCAHVDVGACESVTEMVQIIIIFPFKS